MNMHLNRRSLLLLAGGSLALADSVWSNLAQSGEPIMSSRNEANGAAYLDAWSRKDLQGIGVHLHPSVHFKGPMQELNGRDAVLDSAERIFPLLERLDIRAQFFTGERAMFAYDFICRAPIGVCRTAELVRFDSGLIRDIELFFDARPFEAMQRAGADKAPPK
jgi:hypothetical protein